jgi:hypothetical protein
MNCCGNKRKEWLNEANPSKNQATNEISSETLIADKPDRVFEYTGNHSLTIHGLVSGKTYHFKSKGEKLTVAYADSFAFMAERDLKVTTA